MGVGRVDNPSYKRLRPWIVQQPQMRQHLAHCLVTDQWRLPDRLIRDAGAVKRLAPARRVQCAEAVEHREVGERVRRGRSLTRHPRRVQRKVTDAAHHLLDLMDDVLRLGLVGRRAVDVELDLVGELRQDLDRLAIRVARDHLAGRVQDALAGAIVAAQVQRHRAGVILLEPQEVAPIRAAKTVDRLVGIADDAKVD